MAGSLNLIDSVSGISVDTTNLVKGPSAGHAAATFLLNVIAITGTWTVTVRWHAGSGNKIDVATLTGINSTGLKRLALTADFNAPRMAIPAIVEVLYDNTAAGSLTAEVLAAYGD